MPESSDERLMREAVRLSRRGFPAPNPHVGCVIARDGVIVGRGYHRYAGGDHAEVVALRQAGPQAAGATAYVTLEPCNHTGRTPPCSEALISAGIARVVVACPDPNPKARGGGERLREAGRLVERGLLAEEAAEANRPFLFAMAAGRPFVTVKAAMSLDGRIALPNGQSRWITGERARKEAHRLRAEMGAVLVGRRTVELDDPRLDCRIPGVVNAPIPIVLDPKGRLSGTERVLRSNPQTVWVAPDGLKIPLSKGRLDLSFLLRELFQRGLTGVLVEGGGHTIAGFFEADLVDRIDLFVAPKVLGSGLSWVEGSVLDSVDRAVRTGAPQVRRFGDDLKIRCEMRELPATA